MAIHKPSGLLVHKSPIDRHETRYAMKLLRDQLGQWVYPVHRLDKPTSGLLLFALDKSTAALLGEQFESRHLDKTYQALVRGYAIDTLIDHPLKDIADFKHQQAAVEARDARSAVTHVRVLQHMELPFADGRFPTSRYSLLELKPETGRKHQLRRHLKHISHPIIGDVKYGKGPHNRVFREHFDSHRLLLAATAMTLTHPHSGERLHLSCPLEDSFADLLQQLAPFVQEDFTRDSVQH